VSSTNLIERSRKQNLKMEKLVTYRNIFASSKAKIQQQLQVVAQDVSPKDFNIAKWLGLSNQEKEEIEENKEVLIIIECGVPNYSTKEIKNKIMQSKSVRLAKQVDLTKRIIANIKQMEVHSKIEVNTR
ncbi:3351_t:CDS:2, partial [Gigaspora margarita]